MGDGDGDGQSDREQRHNQREGRPQTRDHGAVCAYHRGLRLIDSGHGGMLFARAPTFIT
jgi:hypothetical protein